MEELELCYSKEKNGQNQMAAKTARKKTADGIFQEEIRPSFILHILTYEVKQYPKYNPKYIPNRHTQMRNSKIFIRAEIHIR